MWFQPFLTHDPFFYFCRKSDLCTEDDDDDDDGQIRFGIRGGMVI